MKHKVPVELDRIEGALRKELAEETETRLLVRNPCRLTSAVLKYVIPQPKATPKGHK